MNPPFNKGIVTKAHTKYYDCRSGITGKMGNYGFVRVGLERAEPGGVVKAIMPTNFMILSNGREFRKFIRTYDIEKIEILPTKGVFDEVNLSGEPCVLTIRNRPPSGSTAIVRTFGGEKYSTTVDLMNPPGLHSEAKDAAIFPMYLGNHGKSLLGKVMSKGERLVRLQADKRFEQPAKSTADEDYKFKMVSTPNAGGLLNYNYTKFTGPDMRMIKVILSHMQHATDRLNLRAAIDYGEAWVHMNNNYFEARDVDEAKMLQRWFNHPLFKLCFIQLRDLQKIMDYNFGYLTKPNLASNFSDNDLFEFYGVTKEEANFVQRLFH